MDTNNPKPKGLVRPDEAASDIGLAVCNGGPHLICCLATCNQTQNIPTPRTAMPKARIGSHRLHAGFEDQCIGVLQVRHDLHGKSAELAQANPRSWQAVGLHATELDEPALCDQAGGIIQWEYLLVGSCISSRARCHREGGLNRKAV